MNGDERPLEVYTVYFPEPTDSWLRSARHHDLRLELAVAAIDALDDVEECPLIVLPAGFLRVASPDTRDQLAGELRAAAERADAALVFGVDVGSDADWAPLARPPRAFAYACDGGTPRLWGSEQCVVQRGRDRIKGPRVLELGGRRVGVLLGAEVFSQSARRLVAEAEPEVIVVLTHTGPTERWHGALDLLRKIAPVVLSGAPADSRPPWVQRASGWIVEVVGELRSLSIHRHRRLLLDPLYEDDLPEAPSA